MGMQVLNSLKDEDELENVLVVGGRESELLIEVEQSQVQFY